MRISKSTSIYERFKNVDFGMCPIAAVRQTFDNAVIQPGYPHCRTLEKRRYLVRRISVRKFCKLMYRYVFHEAGAGPEMGIARLNDGRFPVHIMSAVPTSTIPHLHSLPINVNFTKKYEKTC